MPLLHYNARVVDFYFSRCQNHLMIFMLDMDTKTSEFTHKAFDLSLEWISAHVAKVLVACTAKNFKYGARQTVGDGNLGLIW